MTTQKHTAHLQAKNWQFINRHLIKKAIGEFSHELILLPELLEEDTYRIISDTKKYTYQFKAKKFLLDHWLITPESIIKLDEYLEEVPLDALDFIMEFKESLKIPSEFLATYLEEITSTLLGIAYKYENQQFSATELALQSFQDIEHGMTEGHPCFVANNGRIGFNSNDYQLYAPETNQLFKILWIAVHKKYATFTSVEGFEYEHILESELGNLKTTAFYQQLENRKKNRDEYLFMPVHPWQWINKIIPVFGAAIAQEHIIQLGESDDEFSAQQSIRTLFNTTNPKKLYTKTALSILNMGFMRGLSPYYMKSTPPITKWITGLLSQDNYLKDNGFTMLGEVATIGYENHYYKTLGKTNGQNKMLATLWRESPFTKINEHQRVLTMASFLHEDYQGNSFIASLISASPHDAFTWVKQYLKAYLAPLLHCFYKYELVFMPHGENLIIVLENHTPVHVLMKDITEEVIVFNKKMDLPEHVDRLYTETSDTMKVLSVFTDIFDCFFRFLSQQLHVHTSLKEEDFWQLVANCVYEYQEEFPEFSDKYKRYDLFVKEFDRCCLNRLQLSNTKQMLDLTEPIESLRLVGVLKNPLAKFRKETLIARQGATTIN